MLRPHFTHVTLPAFTVSSFKLLQDRTDHGVAAAFEEEEDREVRYYERRVAKSRIGSFRTFGRRKTFVLSKRVSAQDQYAVSMSSKLSAAYSDTRSPSSPNT